MNILREVRRVNEKSIATRIRLLLTFSVMLIVSTYAWHSSQKDVKLKSLEGGVTSWDVSYYVNEDENENLDRTAVFTIEDLYPGMTETEDFVHIYNIGESSTSIEYVVKSVKVFGTQVYGEGTLEENKIELKTEGNTTYIFSADESYPFIVSFTYDRDYLKGKYVDEETTADAHATFELNASWAYENDDDDSEDLEKDQLDTEFGKSAYEYYQTDGNDKTKAIEIQIRITSSMIHPSLES